MMSARFAGSLALLGFLGGLSIATFADLKVFLAPILTGAVVTVQVSVMAWIVFIAMSVSAGMARARGTGIVRWVAIGYIEVFRGTSLLVILFWLFFVMPEFGVNLSPMTAGVLGVGLNFGGYGAEVVRGAVLAVPRGQTEATIALNMNSRHRLVRIIFPQAVAIMIPGMTNLTIEMIKATALVSAVTLVDITYASVQQNQLYFRTAEIFSITLLLYYCLAQFIRFGGSALESRFTAHLPKRV